MKDPIETLNQVIELLCDIPDTLQSNPVSTAFTLGCIVTSLEDVRDQLRNSNNGDV